MTDIEPLRIATADAFVLPGSGDFATVTGTLNRRPTDTEALQPGSKTYRLLASSDTFEFTCPLDQIVARMENFESALELISKKGRELADAAATLTAQAKESIGTFLAKRASEEERPRLGFQGDAPDFGHR